MRFDDDSDTENQALWGPKSACRDVDGGDEGLQRELDLARKRCGFFVGAGWRNVAVEGKCSSAMR